MRVIVHDASILIDLIHSESVDAWFSLGIETWTTDLVFPLEIDRPEQNEVISAYVESKALRIRPTTAKDHTDYYSAKPPGLSLADVSICKLAEDLGPESMLATGDRALRSYAETRRVRAIGFLGLFEVMLNPPDGLRATLLPKIAALKLQKLIDVPDCWIPRHLCEERIRRWGKMESK